MKTKENVMVDFCNKKGVSNFTFWFYDRPVGKRKDGSEYTFLGSGVDGKRRTVLRNRQNVPCLRVQESIERFRNYLKIKQKQNLVK